MGLDYTKVLVGVSGGVDSSVCLEMLKNQGLDVLGVVIRFSKSSDGAVEDAKKVCDHLSIPLYVADATGDFEQNVVLPFCRSYVGGQTPNPCVICNPLVKFATIEKLADELNVGYISTGHYAQVEKVGGVYHIKKAMSAAKDQSYMLYRLSQKTLSRLLLPLGQYEKSEIREKAKNVGLFTADKADSQEICFIPDKNYADFIQSKGFTGKSGFFISPEGQKLKKHLGVHHYTVGQRKGLGIALGEPAFIKEIAENGDILLGYAGEDLFSGVTLKDVVYTADVPFCAQEVFTVKIRSAAKGDEAVVEYADKETIRLRFASPLRAAAKGQSVVCYKGELIVGGGFISSAEKL
ncbi:MAG: tRNA 2-thiouridine(34) synthase MnmA [Oscillospiraceae bacterium]